MRDWLGPGPVFAQRFVGDFQEELTKAKPVPGVSVIVIEVQPGQVTGPVQQVLPTDVQVGRTVVPPGIIPAIASATTKANALSPSVPYAGPFQAMDTNKDGKISRAEFKGPQEVFADVDANHDGSITQPEATRYLAFIGLMHSRRRPGPTRRWTRTRTARVGQDQFKGPKAVFSLV